METYRIVLIETSPGFSQPYMHTQHPTRSETYISLYYWMLARGVNINAA